MISSKPPNIVFPNLVLWWIMSQSVMQKDWFDIYKVKVTARAHMIKIQQFPLVLLPNLVARVISQSVLWRNWIVVFKVKVTAKFQNVNECLPKYFMNHWTFLLSNLVRWCIVMSRIIFQKDWFAVFKIKVTVKDNIIKIWLFNILSELLILLQLNLAWWHIIISLIVLWKYWIALL